MAFQKATREKSKLRLALAGPSGAGKTLSALLIAYGITNDWSKIALIDTEHGRAKFYANRSDFNTGEFLYQEMTAPYSPDKYINMVREGAEAVGADGVVIVDSFSHAWDNEGGVLDIKSDIAQNSKKNDYTAWSEAGKIQNNLVNSILSANCHTIITLRTKMAYAMEENDKGKLAPVKIGLAPVQRENTEYEFDIVLNIARNHIASASKDTTFLDTWSGIITPELGKALKDWLDEGVEPEICSDCNKKIFPVGNRTIQQIVDGTLKNYGRKLCWNCMAKEIKKLKEQKSK
ncbi:MAG: ATP-binding protein [Oscillospiraceae bacterium]|nr:ATP-binding protein [Oscillospiraceae bacterium]